MTKTDEFIKKVERLDPHLTVDKYHNLYDHDHNKVIMIVWYTTDNDVLTPFATFTYNHDTPVVETDRNSFGNSDLYLYSKVINLCLEYFSYLFEEER